MSLSHISFTPRSAKCSTAICAFRSVSLRSVSLWKFCCLSLAVVFCSGCVPALPGYGSGANEARRQAYDATEAASEARRHADEARTEMEKSETLLHETRVMIQRAEAANAHCQEIANRISKQQSRTIIRARGKAKPIEAVQPAAVATPAPQEPVKPELPKHSASDAPY